MLNVFYDLFRQIKPDGSLLLLLFTFCHLFTLCRVELLNERTHCQISYSPFHRLYSDEPLRTQDFSTQFPYEGQNWKQAEPDVPLKLRWRRLLPGTRSVCV